MFCGLVCGGSPTALPTWLGEMLADTDPQDLLAREMEQDLRTLAAETLEAVDGPGLGFSPLLPGDQAPVSARAAALREWCQGFLYGLGLTGTAAQHLSAETAEALHDLADIARLDAESLTGSEEDEEAYTELAEFVWVAAMLIREERAPEEVRP